jgi:hypothetical protein
MYKEVRSDKYKDKNRQKKTRTRRV